MNICPHCGHANPEDVLVCEHCNQALFDKDVTLSLRQLPDAIPSHEPTGSDHFAEDASLVIEIPGSPSSLTLQPSQQITLGRAIATSSRKPDVDLGPYGAFEKGVSRVHAAIQRQGDALLLVDMESTNGTFLNGRPLLPDSPQRLRDGDEIRLGGLAVYLYFQFE